MCLSFQCCLFCPFPWLRKSRNLTCVCMRACACTQAPSGKANSSHIEGSMFSPTHLQLKGLGLFQSSLLPETLELQLAKNVGIFFFTDASRKTTSRTWRQFFLNMPQNLFREKLPLEILCRHHNKWPLLDLYQDKTGENEVMF